METTYKAPTAQQLEEARALVFIADAQEALQKEHKIWTVTLSMELMDADMFGNRRKYLVGHDRTGKEVARTYINKNHGGPSGTAYYIACDVKAAERKAREAAA